jgi:hypothetical protein
LESASFVLANSDWLLIAQVLVEKRKKEKKRKKKRKKDRKKRERKKDKEEKEKLHIILESLFSFSATFIALVD